LKCSASGASSCNQPKVHYHTNMARNDIISMTPGSKSYKRM